MKNEQRIAEIISAIASAIPDEPSRIWSKDGDEILCDNEQIAEAIADLFDAMYGGEAATTGYYDPVEDERNGETDERTGFYYVRIP